MSTNDTINVLHPDVRDSLKSDDWTDVEIEEWLTGHNAQVRRDVLQEEPSDAECIAALNAVSVPFLNWRDRIAKACEGKDVNSSHLDIREVVEYAGVKDGEVVTSWTEREGDIRQDSNYLDGMVKRTTTYIKATASASTPEEHAAGKHTRGVINGGQ